MPINSSDLTRVLVLASGGLDSTACIEYYSNRKNTLVEALFINYGQPALVEETKAVRAICQHYEINLKEVLISSSKKFGAGFVQGRNALLLNAALMFFEESTGIISIGIHAGTNYADCSQNFTVQMQHLFDLYTNGKIFIDAPFLSCSKAEIWSFCKQRNIPIHLTYSCEKGGEPCGKCLSCMDLEVLHATR